MFACAKGDCSAPAEWEPTLVIVSPTEEIRVGVPVPVCTAHRRGLRQVLLEGGIPRSKRSWPNVASPFGRPRSASSSRR